MTYTMLGVPVGNYQIGHLANLGINHWSVDIGSGYNTYLNMQNGRELSVVAGFIRNFENYDTQYRNGNNLHLDWGASQALSKYWHIGLVGYFYHQITGDSKSGALLGNFKSSVNGIDSQAGYQFTIGEREVHLNISLSSVKSSQIMIRIVCLSSSSKGLHDGEFCQFLTGCNSQSTYTGQVVSIGFGDPFDQAMDAQPFEITR